MYVIYVQSPHCLCDVPSSGYLDSGGGFNQFTGGIMGTAMEMGLVETHIMNVRKYYQVSKQVRELCIRPGRVSQKVKINHSKFDFYGILPLKSIVRSIKSM